MINDDTTIKDEGEEDAVANRRTHSSDENAEKIK